MLAVGEAEALAALEACGFDLEQAAARLHHFVVEPPTSTATRPPVLILHGLPGNSRNFPGCATTLRRERGQQFIVYRDDQVLGRGWD